jgi:copper chaperone CopZ
MAKIRLHTPDISCEGCAGAIQRALGRLEGIRSVRVDVAGKGVEVEYEEAAVTPAAILERLSRAGYDSTVFN